MASTSLADYQVLRDVGFTLDAEGPGADRESFTFDVPDDLTTSTSGARKAVLTFNFNPQEDSHVRVFFRGSLVLNKNFDRSHTRMHSEVFDIGDILLEDFGQGSSLPSSAPLEIRVVTGRVTFSDIVLWYQINR